ncbi:CPBP family intramembrane glutamic endopeptidase [Anoxybacteroides tepidamans]|uniref:CPBP family intramembrane glutamic endopeptidase n=1 Tax=Anoxybacteroides tepidamans TaxID=265948 RepID=UPI00048682BC|nr:CPBP family intramembrane glutamic endopeptidase [Anoxybacillus tepidamans]
MRRQTEQIQAMNDREVLLHLYITQFLLLAASGCAGVFLFDKLSFQKIWHFDAATVIRYGGGGALAVLVFDFLLMRYVPQEWYDDGGINEKIFQKRSIPHLLLLCALIAFSEELLFRGVIQTHFGLWIASAIFAVLHFRYLAKWLLFATVVLLSFFLGYLYDWTGSLWVTIFAHFLIDFVLAVRIRLDYLQTRHQDD